MNIEEWRLTNQEVAELQAKGGDIAEAQKAKKEAYRHAQLEGMRLTPEELLDNFGVTYSDNIPNRNERLSVLANTATDKANKWWIDWLESKGVLRDEIRPKYPFESRRKTEEVRNIKVWRDEWQALKKLVGGE